jgi:hypothetical protein
MEPETFGARREIALRLALAALPCAVLIFYLPGVLGRVPLAWIVPIGMAFANAFATVSLGRQYLGSSVFHAFWICYAILWAAAASGSPAEPR